MVGIVNPTSFRLGTSRNLLWDQTIFPKWYQAEVRIRRGLITLLRGLTSSWFVTLRHIFYYTPKNTAILEIFGALSKHLLERIAELKATRYQKRVWRRINMPLMGQSGFNCLVDTSIIRRGWRVGLTALKSILKIIRWRRLGSNPHHLLSNGGGNHKCYYPRRLMRRAFRSTLYRGRFLSRLASKLLGVSVRAQNAGQALPRCRALLPENNKSRRGYVEALLAIMRRLCSLNAAKLRLLPNIQLNGNSIHKIFNTSGGYGINLRKVTARLLLSRRLTARYRTPLPRKNVPPRRIPGKIGVGFAVMIDHLAKKTGRLPVSQRAVGLGRWARSRALNFTLSRRFSDFLGTPTLVRIYQFAKYRIGSKTWRSRGFTLLSWVEEKSRIRTPEKNYRLITLLIMFYCWGTKFRNFNPLLLQLAVALAYRRRQRPVIHTIATFFRQVGLLYRPTGLAIRLQGKIRGYTRTRRIRIICTAEGGRKHSGPPLQSLALRVWYGYVESLTAFGPIGVRLWVYGW